mgnify:CR=1 FL=1
MKKRAALYGRVSTLDQDADVQMRELRNYAVRRGWEPLEYVDQGVSGAKTSRPALDRLLADARKRKVDVVVVWALDRLGRSLSHLVGLVDEFGVLGVDLCVFSQPIDTTTPAGKLTFQVLGAVAEFERQMCRSRVRAGLAQAKAKGVTLGRPRAEVDVARVLALKSEGSSQRKIARDLGVSRAVIARVLSEALEVVG